MGNYLGGHIFAGAIHELGMRLQIHAAVGHVEIAKVRVGHIRDILAQAADEAPAAISECAERVDVALTADVANRAFVVSISQ